VSATIFIKDTDKPGVQFHRTGKRDKLPFPEKRKVINIYKNE
jgi:hypothetical protein